MKNIKKMSGLEFFGLPLTTIFGISLILVFLSFTSISILLYPGNYNPIDNYLSDLGLSESNIDSDFFDLVENTNGAIFFNVGLIVTGIIFFLFSISLFYWYINENRQRILLAATQIMGCLTALALILLGVFSENYWDEHLFLSYVFFFFSLLWLISLTLFLSIHPSFSKFKIIYGIIAISVNIILLLLFETEAILEWITVASLIGYVILVSYSSIKLEIRDIQ